MTGHLGSFDTTIEQNYRQDNPRTSATDAKNRRTSDEEDKRPATKAKHKELRRGKSTEETVKKKVEAAVAATIWEQIEVRGPGFLRRRDQRRKTHSGGVRGRN